MPVHIRNVNADIRTQPAGPSSRESPADLGLAGVPDQVLLERLRPIVMDILRRELEELRRRRG